MTTEAPPADYSRALADRGVTDGSTWLHVDNNEMFVVMPQDEDVIRELCTQFACAYTDVNARDNTPQWIRVIKLGVNKGSANVDVVFVPWMCGRIDKGFIKRIG